MSFSLLVKQELNELDNKEQCCILAEETGKALMEGRLDKENKEDKKYIGKYFKKNAKPCCRKAFLRGIFLSAGFINDPQKSYQMEITFSDKQTAKKTENLMKSMDLNAKNSTRRNHSIVYLKDRDSISDFLNIIGAHKSLMEFENARILKEYGNYINRTSNCEMANMDKSIATAIRQKKAIDKIRKSKGLDFLAPKLKEAAVIRMEQPEDVSIQQMAEMLEPPISKSGFNHRLKKIEEIADMIDG